MRRIRRYLAQAFDRAFSRGRGGQFLWLVMFIVAFFLIFWGLSCLLPSKDATQPWPVRIMELLLDPGAFVGSYRYAAQDRVWITAFQLLITVVGAVFFTSFMINSIGSWLDRKVEEVATGRRTYMFDGHVVFFGANAMLETVLKSLTAVPENRSRDYVIVTDGNVEKVRNRVYAQLPERFYRNVYIVYGSRTEEKGLADLHLNHAKSIYILGEDAENFHDAKNLECWNLLRSHCTQMAAPIDCFLVLDRASAVRSFLYMDNCGSTGCLHLTLINAVENLAQRVLVSRGFEGSGVYPSLDGDGISAESGKQVHIVIFGMTQISHAMATTAAHICHFPNFRKGIRTRITFVAADIQQEMDYFKGRYSGLMDLSYSAFVTWEKGKKKVTEHFPEKAYMGDDFGRYDEKGFLDVEWEFVSAGIETDEVRTYLKECVARHDEGLEQLTLALCEHDADGNVAASMCLPPEVYDSAVPVFVYQPYSGEVLNFARDTGRYSNIYPFGLKVDCFDPWLQARLKRARRIQYIYDMRKMGLGVDDMPDDAELIAPWYSVSYSHQLSNVYAANSLEVKLRSIRPGCTGTVEPLSDEEVAIVAETEHNRWNVERLLCGMRAMPAEQRRAIKADLNGSDKEAADAATVKINELKSKYAVHINIVPYEEMSDEEKAYDISIAESMPLVLNAPEVVYYEFEK